MLEHEMSMYEKEVKEKLPKIYSKELIDTLFYEVYTRGKYVENACGVTRLTAASYLKQLENIGLLESEKIGRDRIYKNTRLIKALNTDLEIRID
jgi:predicted transcriptional regulator